MYASTQAYVFAKKKERLLREYKKTTFHSPVYLFVLPIYHPAAPQKKFLINSHIGYAVFMTIVSIWWQLLAIRQVQRLWLRV